MLFRACKAAVGNDAPQVQDTLAQCARWSVLSAHYALRAVELGLETEEGQRRVELAIKLDQRVERLDVTAIDLADRLGTDAPQAKTIVGVAGFEPATTCTQSAPAIDNSRESLDPDATDSRADHQKSRAFTTIGPSTGTNELMRSIGPIAGAIAAEAALAAYLRTLATALAAELVGSRS